MYDTAIERSLSRELRPLYGGEFRKACYSNKAYAWHMLGRDDRAAEQMGKWESEEAREHL